MEIFDQAARECGTDWVRFEAFVKDALSRLPQEIQAAIHGELKRMNAGSHTLH